MQKEKKNQLLFWILFIFSILLSAYWEDYAIRKELDQRRVAFLMCLWLPIALSTTSLFFKGRVRYLVLASWHLIHGMTLLANVVYFRYFENPLPINAFSYSGQLTNVLNSIFEILEPKDLKYFVLPLIIFAIGFTKERIAAQRFSAYSVLKVCVLILSLVIPIFQVLKTIKTEGKSKNHKYSDALIVSQMGVFTFHFYDLYRTIFKSKQQISDQETQNLEEMLSRAQQLNQQDTTFFGIAKGYNVVFIQIESLQSFAIDMVINDTKIAPFLHQLKSESVYFENCLDITGAGRTSDGEFSALNGLYPIPGKVIPFHYKNASFHTLPKQLREHNYQTLSFHGFRGYFWNRALMHTRFGIEKASFEKNFSTQKKLGWGIPDKEFLLETAQKLNSSQSPYFALVITLSLHHPYNDQPPSAGLTLDPALPKQVRNYLQLVNYTDRSLETFFKTLDDETKNKTLFVIYGDHDAGIDRNSRQQFLEQTGINLNQIAADKVPLFFYGLGNNRLIEKREDHCSLVDLYPSVTHLLGLPVPDKVQGVNLFASEVSRPPILLRTRNAISFENQIQPIQEAQPSLQEMYHTLSIQTEYLLMPQK